MSFSRIRVLTLLFGLGLLLPLFVAVPLRAQSTQQSTGAGSLLRSSRVERPASVDITAGIVAEGIVSPDTYRVGPGDSFILSIGGSDLNFQQVTVTPDGFLTLPDVGNVFVGGLTLSRARQTAIDALRKSYRSVPVEIALSRPRQFYVHVSGAVRRPGRYLSGAVTRLSDVLDQADLDTVQTESGPAGLLQRKPSLRQVRITRGKEQITVDLQRYYSAGELDQNPYLLDGDVVFIPSYDPLRESVYVSGAVMHRGAFPYKPGDTLEDVIFLANGESLPKESGRVRVVRRNASGGIDTLTVTVSDAASMPLRVLDHIFVQPEHLTAGVATAEGWIKFPGTYPIEPGRTTVGDLLRMAGGPREGALAHAAYLKRIVDTVAVAKQISRQSGLDFISRTYAENEATAIRRISIDLDGGAAPIYLSPGDILIVPRDDRAVYVFGQVARAGLVPFDATRGAAEYIAIAGGTTADAGQVYMIEAGTGRYYSAPSQPIRSGDMIFVDRKEDLANTPELYRIAIEENRARSEARFRTAQTWLQITGTVASLVITYISFRSFAEKN